MPTPLRSTEGLTLKAYTSVLWIMAHLNFLFVADRLFIEIRTSGRLAHDDELDVLSWIIFFSMAFTLKFQLPVLYSYLDVALGRRVIGPGDLRAFEFALRSLTGLMILFHTGLWSMKVGILISFKQFGINTKRHVVWWWCALIIVMIGYTICFVNADYRCTLNPIEFIMVLPIPTIIVWNLRTTWKRKLFLVCICGVTVLVIVVVVVRTAFWVQVSESMNPDTIAYSFGVYWNTVQI
ncbi:hypothetical protein B0J11DRAFT_512513 [Dendryphion nanum]|uniref:Uncharacterized protein n=1 Tax=Dendryphion nanum TaxID=256645 RepID=A0A9P9D0N7_9PLEO|nr:hypothetical protein B0J11DRAFT_512513 [Dendryphion nanum]